MCTIAHGHLSNSAGETIEMRVGATRQTWLKSKQVGHLGRFLGGHLVCGVTCSCLPRFPSRAVSSKVQGETWCQLTTDVSPVPIVRTPTSTRWHETFVEILLYLPTDFLAQFVNINKPSSILIFIIWPWEIMFPFSENFVAGLLQQVCQLCEEQPGRDAEAGGEKSFCLQKSSTFFLNWN